jgi:putative ABC transport system permease protein
MREPPSLHDTSWDQIRDRFHAGDGVLVSDTLSRILNIGRGDRISLSTPRGLRAFQVLAVWTDIFGGDAGSIAAHDQQYRAIWNDAGFSRLHLTVAPGFSPAHLRDEIQRLHGIAHRLRAVTVDETRDAVIGMVDQSFAGAYSLILVMVAVAMLGVVNFLLAALLSRRRLFQLLHAVGLSVAQLRGTLIAEAGLIGLIAVSLGLVGGSMAGWTLVIGCVPALFGWRFDFVMPVVTAATTATSTIVLALTAGVLPGFFSLNRRYLHGGIQQ